MDNVATNNGSQACPAENAGRTDSSAHEITARLRIRRIEDLQLEALAKPDALEANLGAANAGLLRMGFRLEEALEGALANMADRLTGFARLAPVFDCYLKVTRQADRFAHLTQRLVSARQAGNAAKPS